MPRMVRRFSVIKIRNALQHQACTTLPKLPQGYFDVVAGGDGYQVALFKHALVAGCRSTTSYQHSQLPWPVLHLKDAASITKEPTIRVGFRYIYGHDQPYNVSDGEVSLIKPTLPVSRTEATEVSRTISMIISL